MKTPPLHDIAPPLRCTRWLGDQNCGEPAVVHVAWDAQIENGLACETHRSEIGTRWSYWQMHDYDPICSIGGARWVWDGHGNSHCQVDDVPTLEQSADCKQKVEA